MKKKIDIVDIKNADYLKFYVLNGFIYCENECGERVIVAGLKEEYDELKEDIVDGIPF